METRLELLALVLIALVSGWYGYVLARRWKSRRRALLAVGCVLVVWPIAVVIWPEHLQFLYPPFLYGDMLVALGFSFVGMLAALYGHSARKRVLTEVLGVVFAYFVFAGPIHLAIDGEAIRALNYDIRQGVTVQETFYTCVPAALATVLRRWGYEYTEGELAYALRTSYEGTVVARVPSVVARLPLRPPFEARVIDTTYEELARYDVPVILTGKSGPILHSVALLGLEGGVVTIGDPLTGPVTARIEELGKRFEWSGKAILIQPTGALPAIRPHLKRCEAGARVCGL